MTKSGENVTKMTQYSPKIAPIRTKGAKKIKGIVKI